MPSAVGHTGENAYGKNPKSYRKFVRKMEKASANPVPDGEQYWKNFWEEGKAAVEDWSAPPPKTESELLKENLERSLECWPWDGVPRKLLTVAPYAYNYYNDEPPFNEVHYPFSRPEASQSSKLFTELFRARPILETIAKYLFQYHDASWKFFATCQEASRTMSNVIGFWDVTGRYFGHCEEPPTQGRHPDSRVSLITIVTPVRRPEGKASYVDQVENLHSLCLSVYNFAENIRHIQFHRVPLISVRVLELLIPKMRRLQTLGIYKCQLVHVGDTMKLLEIIKTDRHFGSENQVSLDFFPNAHRGPNKSAGRYYAGNYGACWDNWFGATDLAIWAQVVNIIPQARKQGVDFESPHTAFRQWLEKSPCWRVDEVLEAISDPSYDIAKFAALVDCRNPDHHGDVQKFKAPIWTRPSGWRCLVQRLKCNTCRFNQLGIFYWFGHLRNVLDPDGDILHNSQLQCLGCKFRSVLNREKDHYKQRKRNLIRHWLREIDGEWNDADLLKAITDITEKQVIAKAKDLDEARARSIQEDDIDPEYGALQTPITNKEANQRFSSHKRSPTVDEKFLDPKFMSQEEKVWHIIARPERRHEHGF